MITKERLKKLIKQGATIYSTHWEEEVDLKQKCEIVKYSHCDGSMRDHLIVHEDEEHSPSYMLDGLEENVEDAKFVCKYQNIERTDYLNLPTYKDFVEHYQTFGDVTILDEKCVMFSYKTNVYSLYAADEELWIGRDNDGSPLFHKDLNKENYIEACELCVKLFKGESDEIQ